MKNIRKYVLSSDKKQQDCHSHQLLEMYSYKVIRILGSGMLVMHAEFQKLFYMKAIHKTTAFSNDYLVLPDNVPYMVKLHNYYNCENSIFLVLQYCSNKTLAEYIRQKSVFESSPIISLSVTKQKVTLNTEENSEGSYSELINDYSLCKQYPNELISPFKKETEIFDNCIESKDVVINNKNKVYPENKESLNIVHECDSYFQVENYSIPSENLEITNKNLKIQDLEKNSKNHKEESSEVNEILKKSQILLSSIDKTLRDKEKIEVNKIEEKVNKEIEKTPKILKVLSNASSSVSCEDFDEFNEISPQVIIEDAIKWSAQIVLALEKLHSLGVIY